MHTKNKYEKINKISKLKKDEEMNFQLYSLEEYEINQHCHAQFSH